MRSTCKSTRRFTTFTASRARNNSAARRPTKPGLIDRPFDPAILRKARDIASSYQLVIAREPGVGYLGRTVEMPYAMADGKTLDACAQATLEATAAAVATMLEAGDRPPSPARDGKRESQVKIRLTAAEKLALEEAARAAGFRSISDYIRTAALDRRAG